MRSFWKGLEWQERGCGPGSSRGLRLFLVRKGAGPICPQQDVHLRARCGVCWEGGRGVSSGLSHQGSTHPGSGAH